MKAEHKGQIISAKEFSLREIFDSKFEYFIPSYQRPYAWTVEETQTLFDNLYESFKKKEDMYFLGSIVLIKEDRNPKSDVVDGQQRLTTLSILFSCLINAINEQAIKSTLLKALKQEEDIIWGTKESYRLHLRERDKKFFEMYISNPSGIRVSTNEDKAIDDHPQLNADKDGSKTDENVEGGVENLIKKDPKTFKEESQRNIRNNCELLRNRIKDKFKNDAQIAEFVGKFLFERCYMIVVSVADEESAFRIFSLMNSTGLDLLPTDIIKADIIGKIPDDQKDEYAGKWEDLENDTTRNGFHDLFGHIRMINAKKKAEKSLLEEFRNKVLTKYLNPKQFIDSILTPYAETYCYLKTKWNIEEDNISIRHSLMWLNKIDNSDWVPVALEYITKYGGDLEKKEFFYEN